MGKEGRQIQDRTGPEDVGVFWVGIGVDNSVMLKLYTRYAWHKKS